MNTTDKHILEIDSVELSFGERRILTGVYLPVETGCVTAILGRNGCGKSSLMKILSGALQTDFCSMRIDGVWRKRLSASEVAYLSQQRSLPQNLTPEQVMRDFGIAWDDLTAWFPRFEMLRRTCVGELSGGESRILESFAILHCGAQFALLDEPFSQVEPLHISRLKELIERRKQQMGILLTDHMYRHVKGVADRLYVMADGCAYPVRCEEDLLRYGYLNHL